jgi:hypothetical protein
VNEILYTTLAIMWTCLHCTRAGSSTRHSTSCYTLLDLVQCKSPLYCTSSVEYFIHQPQSNLNMSTVTPDPTWMQVFNMITSWPCTLRTTFNVNNDYLRKSCKVGLYSPRTILQTEGAKRPRFITCPRAVKNFTRFTYVILFSPCSKYALNIKYELQKKIRSVL